MSASQAFNKIFRAIAIEINYVVPMSGRMDNWSVDTWATESWTAKMSDGGYNRAVRFSESDKIVWTVDEYSTDYTSKYQYTGITEEEFIKFAQML